MSCWKCVGTTDDSRYCSECSIPEKPSYQALDDAMKQAEKTIVQAIRPVRKSIFTSRWTLEEGLRTARKLERELSRAGWHVALGGGVMKKGKSTKDLDLVVFCHDTSADHTTNWVHAGILLVDSGWTLYRSRDVMHGFWAKQGGTDRKNVEVWADPDGRRVDLIWMTR